jgi:hypothetical protein
MTTRSVALALVLVILVAGLAGCSKDEPEVVANWPAASVERSAERPVEAPKWPLTGLDAPSEDAIAARVVSVKVENSRESRPQSNLQLADVVYETVTEGGITRFNAIFHSNAPSVVGPVRSARLSDVDIVPQYHALFCFSGASSSVNAQVRSAGIENLSEDAGVTKPFTRSSRRASPHNLYADLTEVRAGAPRHAHHADAGGPRVRQGVVTRHTHDHGGRHPVLLVQQGDLDLRRRKQHVPAVFGQQRVQRRRDR